MQRSSSLAISRHPARIERRRWRRDSACSEGCSGPGLAGRLHLFPFAAHLAQSEGADFKVFAEAAKHWGLIAVRIVVVRAGDVIGPLALLAIIDEVVLFSA